MARPNITDVREGPTDEPSWNLTVEYHSSVPHTFEFVVVTLPWLDDGENDVASLEYMVQDGERYSPGLEEIPPEVRDEVKRRGYTLEEK